MGSKEEVKTAPAYTEAVPGPTEKLSIMTAAGKRHDFNVEVVSERETMMQGLMFRSSMPADHGMLFAFPSEGERGFWMKNTYIPLDIVFIGADGKIQNIGYGKPESLETVRSTGPVLHVLELNAGTAEKLGFGPGDVVNHGAFGNPLEE
ncbi:MAG: DUF192 domain-containing protein [Alphaproteobacteria bacterium]|nr:DUF192 domain-containing protein [Alphaproteobacteria bacterium]